MTGTRTSARRLRILALAFLLGGTWALAAGPEARAAELESVGWWSRLATTDPLSESPQALPVDVTTPGTVPNPGAGDDQLVVEGTAEGATAIAAINWTLADAESSPSLTLPVGPGSTVNPTSVVLACRAAVPWSPPEVRPGRWEAKPVADSRACVNGVVAEDASSVAFGLQPLVNGSAVDVVLVPGILAGAPDGADRSTFRWVFDDPGPDALTVVESDFSFGADPVTVTVPTPAAVEPATAGGPSPSPAALLPPPARTAAPTSSPTASLPETSGTILAAPTLDAGDLGTTVPRAVTGALASSSASDTSRAVGVALLLAGAAAAAWTWLAPAGPDAALIGLGRFRRPLPGADAPATAGSVVTGSIVGAAGDAPIRGGLGRFARDRAEPPVPVA